jgi:putative DNA primase/helicase
MMIEPAFAPLRKDELGKPAHRAQAGRIPITPVPAEAAPVWFTHPRFGLPVAKWEYRDGEGRLLGYTVRFEVDGKKQILPRSWCRREDGSESWCWKGLGAPRPLYGLDRLAMRASSPVLVVEGEKTADAGQRIFPDHVVVTWPGGTNSVEQANWSPLEGRDVTLWPDADDLGRTAIDQVRRALGTIGVTRIRTVELPDHLRDGWDLADPIPDRLEVEELINDARPAAAAPSLPPGYFFTKRGLVWREEDEEGDELLVAGPFEVLAETRDGEGMSWGVLLGWNDHDGRLHKHALARAMLAGDGTDARRILLDGGLHVAPGRKAREKLNNFLGTVRSSERARATARIGWHDGVFVLPDETIGARAASETILLQQVGPVKHAFRLRGSLSDWQDRVAKLAIGNSRLVLALSAAFAAALVHPCEAESGGVHLRGPSSTGKSTALVMAASVWGGGEHGGYVRSWRATANGLEGVALAHCDALLCLDELSQVPAREAGEVAYMLGNGAGKSRSTREGLARNAAQWRVLFLSSGEVSLADKIVEEGRGKRGTPGQAVRLIDLPADAGAGLGLFEDLHGLESADAFARHLKAASTSNHGTAARAFLRHISCELEGVRDAIARYSGRFVADHVDKAADGQVIRVAQRFALIGTAGDIAVRAGVLPWKSGTAIDAAAQCFRDWLEMRGGIEPAEVNDGIEQVRAFVAAHGISRFVPAWDERGTGQIMRDVAGYRKREGEGWDYYVTASAWKNEICKGFNGRTIAAALVARQLMVPPEAGRHLTCLVRVPEYGRQRLYHLSSKLVEGGHD